MNVPSELLYTKDHEWVRVDGDECTVGITEYAQGELGDIVFVDLPEVGDQAVQGDPFGTIEAVKAAADLFAPISGEITEINTGLDQSPELINNSPYEDGWIVKIKMSDQKGISELMSSVDYQKTIS